MMRYLMIAAIAAFGVTAAIAQSHHGHHGGHGTAATSAESEATRAYREANAAMHEAMNVPTNLPRCGSKPSVITECTSCPSGDWPKPSPSVHSPPNERTDSFPSDFVGG